MTYSDGPSAIAAIKQLLNTYPRVDYCALDAQIAQLEERVQQVCGELFDAQLDAESDGELLRAAARKSEIERIRDDFTPLVSEIQRIRSLALARPWTAELSI